MVNSRRVVRVVNQWWTWGKASAEVEQRSSMSARAAGREARVRGGCRMSTELDGERLACSLRLGEACDLAEGVVALC